MSVIGYNGRIELIPERDIFEMKGFLKETATRFGLEMDRL